MSKTAAVLAAALAFAGCVPARRQAADGFDAGYLTPEHERTGVAFAIGFVEYEAEESDIIEAAWSNATAPEEKVAALWKENGLRLGFVPGGRMKALRAQLNRLRTRKSRHQVAYLPQFDVSLAGRKGPGGLIYADEGQTAYRDVTDLAVALTVKVFRRDEGFRVRMCPSFSEGSKPAGEIEGLGAEFTAQDGAAVMVGPVEKPGDLTIGTLLSTRPGRGAARVLVLAEMKHTY